MKNLKKNEVAEQVSDDTIAKLAFITGDLPCDLLSNKQVIINGNDGPIVIQFDEIGNVKWVN